jgi:hypothetical protein
MLKVFPFWDPVRGDPRFEQIVASFAPKEASSPGRLDSETEERLPSLYWLRVIADDNSRPTNENCAEICVTLCITRRQKMGRFVITREERNN